MELLTFKGRKREAKKLTWENNRFALHFCFERYLGTRKWLAVVTINIDQHVKENMVTFRSQ